LVLRLEMGDRVTRKRTVKEVFEAGNNPENPQKRNKTTASKKTTAKKTANASRAKKTGAKPPQRAPRAKPALGKLASRPRTGRESPLFEPSQSAAAAQVVEIFEDDDLPDEDDPYAEDERPEEVRQPPEDIWVSVRWRACIGNMEKNAVPEAFNCEPRQLLNAMALRTLIEWVDETVESLKPRVVKLKSLVAVVYTPKTPKTDRLIKALRRDDLVKWENLHAAVKVVAEECNYGKVSVDFDLTLEETPLPSPPGAAAPSASQNPRPRQTATQRQLDSLGEVVAAERAGNGVAIDIRDEWRCKDSLCDNYRYTCWMARMPGQLDRVEKHLPVNGNIVAIWAKEVEREQATIAEPSDNVRLAILRAKDDADRAKAKRRAPDEGSELDKLLKVMLVSQMTRAQQESNVPASAPAHLPIGAGPAGPGAMDWVPIEYGCMNELRQATREFLVFWQARCSGPDLEATRQVEEQLFKEGWDINSLMDKDCMDGVMWTNAFEDLGLATLAQLRCVAKLWRKSYTGLSAESRANVAYIERTAAREARKEKERQEREGGGRGVDGEDEGNP
jgi:hypothetical protein